MLWNILVDKYHDKQMSLKRDRWGAIDYTGWKWLPISGKREYVSICLCERSIYNLILSVITCYIEYDDSMYIQTMIF